MSIERMNKSIETLDCSITDDGILLYQGKHSLTRFQHECLPWNDLQILYSEIVNEPNFFLDTSIKAAENFCRNPNMNRNGPWCFIENGDEITMEQCNVCQSLSKFICLFFFYLFGSTLLETRPTASTNVQETVVEEVPSVHRFFQNVRNDFKQYAKYIQEKFREILDRLAKKFQSVRTHFSDRFNLN